MRQLKPIILISLVIFGVLSIFVTFPIVTASGEVPWKDQGRQYYYDNLDAADRKKIRLAFDYCVPRKQIIDELHLGFATAIASPIGVNFVGVYEPSIEARTYNTTIALGLLTDVFGYEYNVNVNGTNEITKETNEPYFSITLVAPTTNTARSQWSALISYSLNQVGIESMIKWWNWDIIMPRLFLDPIGTGYDYENGGYDMFFAGHDASPDPTYKEYYDKDSFPPSSNCYWIEDGPATSGTWATTGPGNDGAYPNITALWTDVYKEQDQNIRTELLKEYQQWCYDNVPTVIIRQEMQLWALNINLEGFDTFHGIQQSISNWTITGQSTCNIAQSGDYTDFNPLLSNSYYDALIFTNTHVQLARRRGEYNISHAYPWLAENWTHSTNYKTWVVNIRQGNRWSDGETIDADDVVFTYHTILNASTRSPARDTLMNILGNEIGTDGKFSAVKKTGPYQVTFTLPEAYAYVETVLFSGEILPEHQMGLIDLAYWKDDDTNSGETPIVASGPYAMVDFDDPGTVELGVNPYYNQDLMGHNTTLGVNQSNWLPNATELTRVLFKVVKSGATAVSGITTGTCDVIDSHMGIHGNFDEVNDSGDVKILTSFEWGYQEMGINHYNPIFGMNPHDPTPMYCECCGNQIPLDPTGIFFAVLGIAIVNAFLRRKK